MIQFLEYTKTWNSPWYSHMNNHSPYPCDNSSNKKKRFFLCGWRQWFNSKYPLQWRHNEHDGVSNHQPHDCLPKGLFRRRSKKTPKLCITGLCEGNSLVTSNAENVSIWWRYYVFASQRINAIHMPLHKSTWNALTNLHHNDPCRWPGAILTPFY